MQPLREHCGDFAYFATPATFGEAIFEYRYRVLYIISRKRGIKLDDLTLIHEIKRRKTNDKNIIE